MRVIVQDQRHEERYHVRVREVPGYERKAWGSYSGKPGERKDVNDRREVSIELEDSDFTEPGIPETLKGRSKGKHDGTFFVRTLNLVFGRFYHYDEDDNPTEKQRGWGATGSIAVSGPNRLVAGGEGVNSNSIGYPNVRTVNDEDRPFTFANWRAGLTKDNYTRWVQVAREINPVIEEMTFEQLKAAVEGFDNEGMSYRRHPFERELAKIEEGTHFYPKKVVDPLPDWLAEIVVRFHPNTSVLEFIEPDTNTYGPAFPAQRQVVV